jgi:integrase
VHLTKRYLDAAHYRGSDNSRDVRWDDDPRGFGLRIYPSGRKAFILSYRNANGVKRLPTLGDYGVLTLDQARRQAKRLLVSVDDKTDHLAERRKQRLEAKTGSVEALFRAYGEARQSDRHRPMKRPDAALWSGEKFVFPHFGSRPWRDVRRSEVRDWHARIAKPYNANRALQSMRAAFYWRLWQEDDAPGNRRRESDTRNPCAGIDLRPETRRQVRLELADLPKLEKSIDADTDDPYLRAFFRFVLATGCRRSEALALRWSDASLPADGAATATFRDTKAGIDHTVALSAYAAKQLKGLPKLAGNPYVFASRQHGKRLREPGKAWQRIRKAAGLAHLRIHDLRRTFGSWLGDAGFTSKQIGTALGHKSDITSRVYMALGDQSKRAAVDAVGRLITGEKAAVRKLAPRRSRAKTVNIKARMKA